MVVTAYCVSSVVGMYVEMRNVWCEKLLHFEVFKISRQISKIGETFEHGVPVGHY
jgi:hypothetical protein